MAKKKRTVKICKYCIQTKAEYLHHGVIKVEYLLIATVDSRPHEVSETSRHDDLLGHSYRREYTIKYIFAF